MIDFRIEKPRVRAGGGQPRGDHRRAAARQRAAATSCVERTEVRTPLGRGAGRAPAAGRASSRWPGPSAAAEVRAVSDAMLAPRRRPGADRRRHRPPRGLLPGGLRRAGDVHRRRPQRGARARSSRAPPRRSSWRACPCSAGDGPAVGRARALAEGHGGHFSALVDGRRRRAGAARPLRPACRRRGARGAAAGAGRRELSAGRRGAPRAPAGGAARAAPAPARAPASWSSTTRPACS